MPELESEKSATDKKKKKRKENNKNRDLKFWHQIKCVVDYQFFYSIKSKK